MFRLYIIFIVVIAIFLYKYYGIIIRTKPNYYTSNFIIKGREWNIYTTTGLIFSLLCICYLIFSMIILIDVINSLIYRRIDLNLSDLLVTHKFNSLLEILLKDIKGNIIEYDSLLGAREMLFTSFYSILFIFIGIYFFLANSRFIYINNDGIYKLGKLYRWDTNKSHQWERSFGRNILNANVIDIKGRAETIRFIFYDDDKNTLRTLLDTENFTNNEE